jgi:hypothetical protein
MPISAIAEGGKQPYLWSKNAFSASRLHENDYGMRLLASQAPEQ